MKDADFEELNLENEKEEDFDLSNKRTIFTEQGDPEVDSLYRRHLKGRLNVQPGFQRQFVWDKIKSSRLIESALLDIPIPIIYLSEEPDGKDNVIDGQQRLTAFFSFIDGKFPDHSDFKLAGLNVFTELNGKKFNELSEDAQDKIMTTKIRVIKFKKESDGDLQFEIFARLNTGAVPLNDQELRNCVYRGRFNELLKELSEWKDYRYLLGISKPEKRMRDVELVLRFASFYFNSYLDYNSPIKGFLNGTMKKYQNISSDDEYTLRNAFKNTVAIIRSLFGNNAFKRFYSGREKNINGRWETQKFNVSLFDILMYSFAKEDKNTVYQNIDRIREALLDLMTTDQDFIDSIELGTSSKKMVTVRFDKWRLTLQTILGIGTREPRCFSYALKQLLFENDSNCSICGNKILNIDDAAVDHIDQYWTGGRTIPENARLAHRFCNNSRSRRENINIDSELSDESDFIKASKVGELITISKTFSTQKIKRDQRPKKTIEELFEGADPELFSLFTKLDKIIMGISSEIDRYTTSIEVLYKTSFNFVCLAAQKKNNRIRIYLRTIQDKINDPKQLTEKVPKHFGYGNITRVLYLDPNDLDKKYSIGDIMELIIQSYNTTQ
jgi:predicted transport protein